MSIAHSYRWVQRGVESALYTHQCAWCGARLGEVDQTFVRRPDASVRTSHGICPSCSAKQNAELERIRLLLALVREKPTYTGFPHCDAAAGEAIERSIA